MPAVGCRLVRLAMGHGSMQRVHMQSDRQQEWSLPATCAG